ncbi:MAG TPA: histidine kinase dimerization/phosphoacceptor domain -containing protein [Ferruginibacter sp.]|nr:histidine kinase dimerization/phosphoacceptor domain -containing protein [Ferruginibacter sp.]
MRTLLPVVLVLTFGFPSKAQNHTIDSLNMQLGKENNSEKKLEILSLLTDESFNTSFEEAKFYALKGVTLADNTNNRQWQPRFYEKLGRMYANLMMLDSATYFFDKALNGYTIIKENKGQATTYFKIGWVLKRKGKIKQAMEEDLKAMKIMEQLNDKNGIAGAMNRVSEDLFRQERFDEALEYAVKNIAFSKKNKLYEELSFAYRAAGDVKIAMASPSIALAYYDSAMLIMKQINASIFTVLNIRNDRANAIKRMGNYKEALAEYTACLKKAEEVNYENSIYVCLANIGETNMMLGNYPEALKYQLKTVALQEKTHDLSNLTENYEHVSSIYEKMGDYVNALKYQKLSRKMRDSTAKIKSDIEMSELLTQFETEKKDKTIALQVSKISQQKKTQTLYIILAALLVFILFGLFYSYQKRKKKNQLLIKLNGQLDVKNKQNELLLKEIHHRVKNNLELVKSLLALQSAKLSDSATKEVMLQSQSRVQSMGIIHQKLYQGENLGSIEMKDYFINLGEGILDTFNAEDKVKIEYAMDKLELDVDTAVPIGLIVNELLTNSLKYAFPNNNNGNISISLYKTYPETLTLKVADNGVGKQFGQAAKGTGFGSQLIQLLTQQLNGNMVEKTDSGTKVEFQFHINTAA